MKNWFKIASFQLLPLILLTLSNCIDDSKCNSIELKNQEHSESNVNKLKEVDDSLMGIDTPNYRYVFEEGSAISHIDSLIDSYSVENRSEFPFDSLNTKEALLILRKNNPDTLKYFMIYLFLKRHHYDTQVGHISYEVRNLYSQKPYNYLALDTIRDPYLYEFFRFYNPYEEKGISVHELMNKKMELILSYIAIQCLEEYPRYKEYPEIKTELDSLERTRAFIDALEYP